MAETTSLAFPNMFNLVSNRVAVEEDTQAVTTRARLLILTEPTELYNNPNFGVGLKRHMWKYNTENEKAVIKDRIVEQLRLNEKYVIADKTQFTDGLLSSGEAASTGANAANEINMTVAMQATFGKQITLDLNSTEGTQAKLTINAQGWSISES